MKILTFLDKWRSRSILAVGSPRTDVGGIGEKSRFLLLEVLVRKWRDGRVERTFFYFFRLLRALSGIRVAWFVEIWRLVGSLVPHKDMLFSVRKHAAKCTTWTTTKCPAEYLILQGQPDVESRRTKLPGYPQELGEVDKNKKKFVRDAHLAISLLKPRGKEIREFPLYHPLRFWATPQPKCCGIAISSRMPKFSLFFSKSPESFKYPSKLVDLSTRSVDLCGALYARRPKKVS